MKVIILGAGQVGTSIARYLAAEENDITIVDQSPEILRKMSDSVDVQPIHGFASHPDILEKAGAADADLLVAVTSSDEVNLVACEVANSLFPIKTKIARLRQQNYLNLLWREILFMPHNLAIDIVISPEVEVARAIARCVKVPGAFEVLSLMEDRVKIVGVRCIKPAVALNTPLRLLPTSLPKLNLVIFYISRDNHDFIPTGEDEIKQGDEVYFAIPPSQLATAMDAFGIQDHEGRQLLILGGGNIGLKLASEIETLLPSVQCKLIERNPQRAELLARQLSKTEVLCGDALDMEVLTEANVQDCETVVAITQDDKVNVLASLLVKREGAHRAMTLLNNMAYAPLVTSLGIDAVINPQTVTVSTILQHIRQGRIRSVYSIRNGAAEIIEGKAREASHVIGLSVDDLHIPHAVRVIALIRDGQVFIDPIKYLLRSDDRLILAVAKSAIKKIENIFTTRPTYL
jgi:trk system potassium uptake protein TrkA